jgi:hypothetical protein
VRKILLALVFFITGSGILHAGQTQDFVTLDTEPYNSAWWVRAQFHPFETQVRGIPVRKIRKNWCKASEFRKELFPQEFQDDLKSTNFAVDGFFDGSNTKQTALVGAYETCDGETGAFFLILDRPRQGPPTIRFIQNGPVSHNHTFASVEGTSDSIFVWYCMCCDFGTRYKWDQSKRTFVVVPEEY